VNKKGEFNVPWGRYKNLKIYDEGNLHVISEILNRLDVRILCCDYYEAVKSAEENDFVYFDPPYQPISPTAYFTAYTRRPSLLRNRSGLLTFSMNLVASIVC
jgi:DNA adenine methylase